MSNENGGVQQHYALLPEQALNFVNHVWFKHHLYQPCLFGYSSAVLDILELATADGVEGELRYYLMSRSG